MIEQHLIALINLILCVISGVILVCRLNAMSRHQHVRVGVQISHAIGAGAMVCSGLRPLIHEWPGYASLMVAAYVLAELVASRHAWHGAQGDAPPPSATAPAPLGDR